MSQSPDLKKRKVVRGHPIHLSDARAKALGFWYDEAAADRAVEFFPRFLRHGKGKWAGKPFWLLPWQELDVIRPLFGWKRLDADGNKTDLRRFREGGVWVPKKNGKTPLGAGILLYCLIADGEFGAECYSAATTRNQAGLIYNDALKMIKLSPRLNRLLKVMDSTKTIVDRRTFSKYQVLSGESGSSEGLNASCVCFDELHAQRNRKLYDALIYSGASREQPLFITLSTAGEYDPTSIGWEQFDHAVKVLSGAIDDPTFFAYVAAADKNDDWRDPATWRKANPSLGVTIDETVFAEEVRRAIKSPRKQVAFKRYRLNMWTQAIDAWLNIVDWNSGGKKYSFTEEDLVGRPCYGAFDLSKTTDLTAWGLWFPGEAGGAARPPDPLGLLSQGAIAPTSPGPAGPASSARMPEGEGEGPEIHGDRHVSRSSLEPVPGFAGSEIHGTGTSRQGSLEPVPGFARGCVLPDGEGGVFLVRYWIPEGRLLERISKGTEPWEQWVADGWVNVTPGDVVDYNIVTADMLADCEKFKPTLVGFDPWNAMQTALTMQEEGWELIEVKQNYQNMSAASKEMERLVMSKRLAHGSNPVLRWQASNIVVMTDPNGNIKPNRDKSTGSIDGVICLIMGIGLGLRQPEEAGFVYTGMGG